MSQYLKFLWTVTCGAASVVGHIDPVGQSLQSISPATEYLGDTQACCVFGFVHSYPAGQGVHAVDPAALISLLAQLWQSVDWSCPAFGFFVPSEHGVKTAPVPPVQLEEKYLVIFHVSYLCSNHIAGYFCRCLISTYFCSFRI